MATPWACDRKSWRLTGVGVRSHLVPGFLKFPTNSLFLASTLITGFPCRQKRRRSLWIWANCASRRGCLGPIFWRFTRREKCSLWSKRATVRALTRMRHRSSCAAILAVVRRVHRKPLMGSPAVSGSSSLSISAITSGFFFHLLASAPGLAYSLPLHGSSPQLPPSPGHRVHIHSQNLRYLAVASMPEFLSFQARIETSMPLIQRAVEQHDGRFQFRR